MNTALGDLVNIEIRVDDPVTNDSALELELYAEWNEPIVESAVNSLRQVSAFDRWDNDFQGFRQSLEELNMVQLWFPNITEFCEWFEDGFEEIVPTRCIELENVDPDDTAFNTWMHSRGVVEMHRRESVNGFWDVEYAGTNAMLTEMVLAFWGDSGLLVLERPLVYRPMVRLVLVDDRTGKTDTLLVLDSVHLTDPQIEDAISDLTQNIDDMVEEWINRDGEPNAWTYE